MDHQIDGLKDVSACLAAIDKTEPQLKAWVELDRDARPQNTHGPLAGIAVGIKDIIDVAGMACRYGSAIYADRIADTDAELVTALRAAGAVLLGKTVTTEFAYMQKSITRNPHNYAFSPGGSSSGSAAAVAAGHIDMAVGTQTGGRLFARHLIARYMALNQPVALSAARGYCRHLKPWIRWASLPALQAGLANWQRC